MDDFYLVYQDDIEKVQDKTTPVFSHMCKTCGESHYDLFDIMGEKVGVIGCTGHRVSREFAIQHSIRVQ